MLNQVVLVGRLVKTPEVIEKENNKKVSYITVAVPRSFKNSEDDKQSINEKKALNSKKKFKEYKNPNYEKALIDSFLLLDELLKNKAIDNFLKKIKIFQKASSDNIEENEGGIINKELLNNNIKNDPFNDYLFFCSSYLDNETNLKYQFPNLEKYLERQFKIGKNNSINDINKINLENKKRKYSPIKTEHSDVNNKNKAKNNIQLNFLDYLDINKDEIMDSEDVKISNSKNFLKEDILYSPNDKISSNLISNDIGTTANVLLLKKNYFYIANVGDSLSVMYKKKKAFKLNKEHKTTSEKELNRLNKIGTKLINYRINGKLNITRAIGDLSYKNRKNGFLYEQDVLAIPEVNKYFLDDVDFIVMGSDGFWDYGEDYKTICDNIYNELKKNPKKDLCDLIGNIFDKALAKANNYLRGTDNMSCIIIQFMKNI